MKRCVCLLLVLLLLSGCRRLYPEDYITVESNQAPYAYRETTGPQTTEDPAAETRTATVSTLGEIRMGIQNLLTTGGTSGRFLLHDYRGDTENLTETVRTHMNSYAPKYVYAMKRLKLTEEASGEDLLLNVSFEPAMSLEEFSEITTCRYPDAFPLIYEALRNHLSSYTIEMIGYSETDFNAILDTYILEHPNEIIEVPRIGVELYPEHEGFVRVVKFSFHYNTDQETLVWQQKTVNSMLDSYQTLFQEDDNPQELLEALYMLLIPAGGYKDDKDATAYSLILLREGSSRMVASVAAYLYSKAGKDCGVVIGEHCSTPTDDKTAETAWEPWYWNWILDGDRYLFFDLHAAALNGMEPALLTYEEMQEYRWDTAEYPDFEPSEPEEPVEPETPEEPPESEGGQEPPETSAAP